MAEAGSYALSRMSLFVVGSHIKYLYQGNVVEGVIAACHNNLLMIHSAASNGQSSLNDVHIINVDCIEIITVEERSTGPEEVPIPKPIDFQKLNKRRLKSKGLKESRIVALSADVAPEGRKLFLAITKTFDEVVWNGDKILILNEVEISPPYRVENVRGNKEASVVHIRKIVDKYWKDQIPNK